jgi:hypothetical protein
MDRIYSKIFLEQKFVDDSKTRRQYYVMGETTVDTAFVISGPWDTVDEAKSYGQKIVRILNEQMIDMFNYFHQEVQLTMKHPNNV